MTYQKKDQEIHTRFDELMALDAVGQVSASEYEELQSHLEICETCREEYREFTEIFTNDLPLAYDKFPVASFAGNTIASIKDSDLGIAEIKATVPAIKLRRVSEQINCLLANIIPGKIPAYISGLVVLGLASAGFFTWKIRQFEQQIQLQARNTNRLKEENEALHRLYMDARRSSLDQSTNMAHTNAPEAQSAAYTDLQATYTALAAQNSSLQQQLVASTTEADNLQEQLISSQAKEHNALATLSEMQKNLLQVKNDLDSDRASHTQDTNALAEQKKQLQDLQARLTIAETIGEHDKQLLAADHDIRDLMGARDLFISEVYEVNGDGKRRKPYGRIFYTKGKSLICYAYDLDQQPGLKNASTFQAWGIRGSDRSTAVNLGVMSLDNVTNKRWVLRFDNPKTLEQLNAVFVTVEPEGESHIPHGKEVLFAYLNESPNHP